MTDRRADFWSMWSCEYIVGEVELPIIVSSAGTFSSLRNDCRFEIGRASCRERVS